jgi:hypothetical protein
MGKAFRKLRQVAGSPVLHRVLMTLLFFVSLRTEGGGCS